MVAKRMKRLYLLRHAKSSWDDDGLADVERPLNKRGMRDAPMMGQRFLARGFAPDGIVSSGAVRAETTARAIAREIGYPTARVRREDALYLAGPATLLEIVRRADDRLGSLMLVGHNPGMTDFANTLSDFRIDNLPTCGLFCADFAAERWREVGPGAGVLVCFDYPKKHDDT
jgi:phosphohistidine phosphatase